MNEKGDGKLLTGRELMIERIKKKMKGQELAAFLGVSQSYVSKMENERQEIPIHIYKKWILILK
jgi:transcriptional regulator with XRE-family HTH domain